MGRKKSGLTDVENTLLVGGVLAMNPRSGNRFTAKQLQLCLRDRIVGRSYSWGTLLPALRRMERMLLLESFWSAAHEEEDGRPRRYYRVTEAGRKAAASVGDLVASPAPGPQGRAVARA